ncbi:hypothetical protein GPX89_43205 [Nocardia sp. ET3-3]|uniref:Uncharacterized protein n=1 Tax=Nocardia terrae TaxID=2675851 RepID=A0A7K1VBK8_9NOCA|nr:hypothetical protein [Nocardia terrae]MVU84025.1 hypothetical protein [Nocardia terrae]
MAGRFRISWAAAIFVAAGMIAGCAGVQGAPKPAQIDTGTLDVGTYPLNRVTYTRPAGTNGGLVEGIRMSGAIASGQEIDPLLAYGRRGDALVNSSDAVRLAGMAEVTGPVLDRDRMLAGWVATGSDRPPPQAGVIDTATSITTAALRFPDAATATRAATELEAADFDAAPDLNHRLELPDYGAAHVHWRPGVPTVGAFLAHGDFVLWVFIQRPQADQSDLLGWLHKVFDVQTVALDAFHATPEKDLPNLRVDSEDMLARVMTRYRDDRAPDSVSFAVYSVRYLLENANPGDKTEWWHAYRDTGADLVAFLDQDSLTRARDAKSARALRDAFVSFRQGDYIDADPPAHVPDVRCLTPKPGVPADSVYVYKCYLAYGRYLAVINDADKTNALQRTAAQYALLANGF